MSKKYYHYSHPKLVTRARELRRPLTPIEAILWRKLKSKQLYGLKFRRQHPFHRFILDFYCHEKKLVIEVDGDSHTEPAQQQYDQARTVWLQEQGLRVIRFTNRDVVNNLEGVLMEIAQQCGLEE